MDFGFSKPIPLPSFFDLYLPRPQTTDTFECKRLNTYRMEVAARKKSSSSLIEALEPFSNGFFLSTNADNPAIVELRSPTSDSTPASQVEVSFIIDNTLKNSTEFFASFSPSDPSTGLSRTLIECATRQFTSGHRSHFFQVLIFEQDESNKATKATARATILYWCPSGAVVSDNFSASGQFMLDFVWRYTRSPPQVRGVADGFKFVEPLPTQIVLNNGSDTGSPSFRSCTSRMSNDKGSYDVRLSSAKHTASPSRMGRAAHTFVMNYPEEEASASAEAISTQPPAQKISVLSDINVNVPHMTAPNRVEDTSRLKQKATETSPLKTSDERPKKKAHKSKRVRTTIYAARPLTCFRSMREVLTAVRDSIKAYDKAQEAGVTIFNIAVSNIVLLEKGGGALIDLDLSRSSQSDDKGHHSEHRTNSWRFSSVRMIQDIMIPPEGGPVPPNRIDALESFLHVLNWIVLRHGRHDLPKHKVEMYLTYLFEFIYGDKEGDVEFIPGRTHKKNFMTMCSIRTVGLEKGPFLDLLEEFTETCAARYLNGVTKYERNQVVHQPQRQQNLESPTWATDLFTKFIDDPRWPADPKPAKKKSKAGSKAGSSRPNKRKRADEEIVVIRKSQRISGRFHAKVSNP